MRFKDHLKEDFEKVFLNSEEFAKVVTIEGQEINALFSKTSGEYQEGGPSLKVSSNITISVSSVIVVDGDTYGVVSFKDDEFGEKRIILGSAL